MTESADPRNQASSDPARLEAASKIIANSAGWSAATGAIPIPVVDMAALAAVQATMISRIAKLYGETLSGEAARSIIAVLLGTLAPAGASVGIMKAGVKLLPGAGYWIGAASMIALSGAATYAVGKVFVSHFEKGGTLATFDPESAKDDLKKEFDSAKATASGGGKGAEKQAAVA